LGGGCFSRTLSPETERLFQGASLTETARMGLCHRDFQESNGMKKTYEKPVFVRKGKLSAVVAGSPPPIPQ
jgi:hypothetical protein